MRTKLISNGVGDRGLPWHVVEQAVAREIRWLQNAIDQPHSDKVPGCDECSHTFRKISLMMVTGEILAKEFIARVGHDLWDDLSFLEDIEVSTHHGGEWHRKMIDVISSYFKRQGFEVIDEPFLPNGRADLGIYKDGHTDLMIEVGGTSIYKLWWNLTMLTNYKILVVPEEARAIEFSRGWCSGFFRT